MYCRRASTHNMSLACARTPAWRICGYSTVRPRCHASHTSVLSIETLIPGYQFCALTEGESSDATIIVNEGVDTFQIFLLLVRQSPGDFLTCLLT